MKRAKKTAQTSLLFQRTAIRLSQDMHLRIERMRMQQGKETGTIPSQTDVIRAALDAYLPALPVPRGSPDR